MEKLPVSDDKQVRACNQLFRRCVDAHVADAIYVDHDSISSRFSQSQRRVHDKAKVITCSYISYSLSHITIHKAHQHARDHIYTSAVKRATYARKQVTGRVHFHLAQYQSQARATGFTFTNLQLDRRAAGARRLPRVAALRPAQAGWTPRRCRAVAGRAGAGAGPGPGHARLRPAAAPAGGPAYGTPGARRCRRAPAGRRRAPCGRGTPRAAPPSTPRRAPAPPDRPSDGSARITHGFAACSVALPLESGECSAAAARNI